MINISDNLLNFKCKRSMSKLLCKQAYGKRTYTSTNLYSTLTKLLRQVNISCATIRKSNRLTILENVLDDIDETVMMVKRGYKSTENKLEYLKKTEELLSDIETRIMLLLDARELSTKAASNILALVGEGIDQVVNWQTSLQKEVETNKIL